MNSKSLSPRYNPLKVSVTQGIVLIILHYETIQSYIPIIKKLPGNVFSFKLLYDKSRISKTGKAPNPRGNEFKRFIEQFRIRNFGIDDNDNGSSSK